VAAPKQVSVPPLHTVPYIPCRTPPRWFSDREDRSKAAFPVRPPAPGDTRSAAKPTEGCPRSAQRGSNSGPIGPRLEFKQLQVFGRPVWAPLGPRVADDRKIAPAPSVGEPPWWCAAPYLRWCAAPLRERRRSGHLAAEAGRGAVGGDWGLAGGGFGGWEHCRRGPHQQAVRASRGGIEADQGLNRGRWGNFRSPGSDLPLNSAPGCSLPPLLAKLASPA
jgi:hypothetical protein